MPPLVIPSGVLIRYIWTAGGSPFAVNVLGATKAGGTAVNQALADTLGAAVKSTFTSSGLAALMPTSVALSQVGVRDISQPSMPEFVSAGAAVAGTATGGKMLPPQIALCVTLRTNKAGRSFRGRQYIPGWHDTALSATGGATAAATAAAKAFYDGVAAPMAGAGLTIAVLSRKLFSAESVGSFQVRDAVWDTIRKRAVPGI
jgi:hypothetical protein